jgi:hypothetical protein
VALVLSISRRQIVTVFGLRNAVSLPVNSAVLSKLVG